MAWPVLQSSVGLTFDGVFNHSKYPVSSFPGGEGGIRPSLSVCSWPNVYISQLTDQVLCHAPEPVLPSRFSVLSAGSLQVSRIALGGSNGTKHLYSGDIFFSLDPHNGV